MTTAGSPVGWALSFPQIDRQIRGRDGDSVFQSARRQGVRIVGACGGRGICGTCIVQVLDGEVQHEAATDAGDERGGGRKWVRACRVRPCSDVTIEVAPRSLAPVVCAASDAGAGDERLIVEPTLTHVDHRLAPATLADPASDADRLRRALGRPELRFDLEVLRALPPRLRDQDGSLRLRLRGSELIDIAAPGASALGLAVDLGTTNAAGFLLDLSTGVRVAGLGLENPQVAWGADVISRLQHAVQGDAAAAELRGAALTAVNALAHDLCHAAGASTRDIVDIVIGGNTAMHHLLLGLPVRQLGRAPFVAAALHGIDAKARELGIQAAPGAWVHVVPNIGGFIGGDHVAALLATEPRWSARGTTVVMDIGTNTEISLIHDGTIRSASSPSGPALEGGHIGCGMRAADGAIERVWLDAAGRLAVATIGGQPALGLCGSGVLDALATMHRAGIVDGRGRLANAHRDIVPLEGRRAAQLAQGVLFTQADVRAVQLAKAAIRSALDLLLDDAGLGNDAIDELLIAGSFGACVDIGSAVAVGMLPPLPRRHIRQVGNASGLGVRMMLVSARARHRAAEIAAQARCVELSVRRDFQKVFVANIGLPPAVPHACRNPA